MGIKIPGHTKTSTHRDSSKGWVGNTKSGRTVRTTTASIPAPKR